MKKIFCSFFLLFIFICNQSVFSQGLGINLKNPGFEDSISAHGVPGWQINYWFETPAQAIGVSKERNFSGKQCLKLVLEKPNESGRFGLSMNQRISDNIAGKKVIVSFCYYSNAKTPFRIAISSQPDNKVPYVHDDVTTKNDGQWHTVNIPLNLSQFVLENYLWNPKQLFLELCIKGEIDNLPATIYIDDVKVFYDSSQRTESDEVKKRFSELEKQLASLPQGQKTRHAEDASLIAKEFKKARVLFAKNVDTGLSDRQIRQLNSMLNWATVKIEAVQKDYENPFAGFEFWQIPAIQNSYPRPDSTVVDGTLSNRLCWKMAKDEITSLSFVIAAKRNLKALRIEIEPFSNSSGNKIDCIKTDLKIVKWWYQDAGGYLEQPSVEKVNIVRRTGIKDLVPELLLHDDSLINVDQNKQANSLRVLSSNNTDPQYVVIDGQDGFSAEDAIKMPDKDADILQLVHIRKDTNRQFWLTVKVPEKSPAGKLKSKMIFFDGNKKLGSVDLELDVLNFALRKPDLISSIYYRTPNYIQYRDFSPVYNTKQAWEQYRKEMIDLRDHGVDQVRFSGPIIGFDWESLGDLSDLKKRLAIRKSLKMPIKNLFLNYRIGAPTQPEELNKLRERIRWVIDEIKEFGVDDVYFYGFDEARGERLLSQRAAWQAVQQAGGKVFVAGFPKDGKMFNAVGDILDLFISCGYPDREVIKRWHDAGKKIGSYSNPQGGSELPEVYRQCYGLQLWQFDYDAAMTYLYHNAPVQPGGSLIWSWNDFCINPDGKWYKQHMMVYPTYDGVIGTLQWEGYREGMNDLRYISTLEKLLKRSANNQSAAKAEAFLAELKNGDVYRENTDLDKLRESIIKHIQNLLAGNAELN